MRNICSLLVVRLPLYDTSKKLLIRNDYMINSDFEILYLIEERMFSMQITIVDDCQMYIYLKDKNVHKHIGSLSDVKCKLLYDLQDNFIGIIIQNERSDTGEEIVLPKVGQIDFTLYKATVTQDEDEIVIIFDQNSIIYKEVEDECILDLCAAGISGVEPMPFTHIGGKEVIKPFIIQDVQDIQLPRS